MYKHAVVSYNLEHNRTIGMELLQQYINDGFKILHCSTRYTTCGKMNIQIYLEKEVYNNETL